MTTYEDYKNINLNINEINKIITQLSSIAPQIGKTSFRYITTLFKIIKLLFYLRKIINRMKTINKGFYNKNIDIHDENFRKLINEVIKNIESLRNHSKKFQNLIKIYYPFLFSYIDVLYDDLNELHLNYLLIKDIEIDNISNEIMTILNAQENN